MDYFKLVSLREQHPSWRLLCAEYAPLVISFFHRVFVKPNVRMMSEADLIEALEDELFSLRQRLGEKAFQKGARYYLNDWAANDKGWLRKFYPPDSDEAHYDLTPAIEKAILWLVSLDERSFVATESRLLTLFDLLRQIVLGSEMNADVRIAELRRQRDDIDNEIARITTTGVVPVLNDTSLRDRFQQFTTTARELLTDFREVEQNFRILDRQVREKIALWEDSKGLLLEEILGKRDSISDSDQGRSFQAFWDFLMSTSRQEELVAMLDRVLELPAIASLKPDSRLKRVHHDWLEAGESTQKTVRLLSEQLRRFLDDVTILENRRITALLRSVEAHSLAVRHAPPTGDFNTLADMRVSLELPFERPLYNVTAKIRFNSVPVSASTESIDASALFEQSVVDKSLLARNIRQALQGKSQVLLTEVLEAFPLEHGLAELVVYMQLASEEFNATIDTEIQDKARWTDADNLLREATFDRIILVR